MKRKILMSLLMTVFAVGVTYAQCDFKYGKNDEDSIRCLEEINSFKVYYNSKAFADAYTPWQFAVQNCPCSWMGLYAYAQSMFDALIKEEQDDARRNILIDSLIASFYIYARYFPENSTLGRAKGMEAYNLMRHRQKDGLERAHKLFIEAIELEGENTQPIILNTFFSAAEIFMKRTGDTTIIIEAYELATDALDAAITSIKAKLDETQTLLETTTGNEKTKLEKEVERLTKELEAYRNTLNNIELKFTPYAPCSVLEKVYSKKLETNKENLSVARKVVKVMAKAGCMESTTFVEALTFLHQSEPSAQTAFLLGNLSFKHNEFEASLKYFSEAANLFEDKEDKIKTYHLQGLVYQKLNQYPNARTAFERILELDPNNGEAHLMIGDLYRNSGRLCSGDDYLPGSVAWLAADKYNEAKRVDPSKTEAANERLRSLSYPDKTQWFMRGLSEGDSYTIRCWIQRSTRVR